MRHVICYIITLWLFSALKVVFLEKPARDAQSTQFYKLSSVEG